ncbi:DNA glycosylase [Guyanagaster necrorhizus]|uniref:DNA-(apurinic or apyrimidinic site) lyase n=1 Tax=Guyanagaster necrorhizus TaxID=856835 RepID=A0A9P8AUD1_9AGAR|nr:DNA glycosylase [Guyanagaster necrorhizus MCA 3950]KAG7447921.1 DNA glycosylase [Guyanagaster necrorhizus MCA 3950]
MATPAGFQALPLPLVQLSLAAVLKCGQSFRWSILPLPKPSDPTIPAQEYRLCLRDRVVCLQQSQTALFYRSAFPEPQPSPTQLQLREAETLLWLNDYFQLNIDLPKLYDEWAARDSVFSGVKERFGGIRMLRQDPWENLISFICSSNNNISRITKMVQSLCTQYSPALLSLPDLSGHETHSYHPFPPPSSLAAPSVTVTLRSLGFGYRAEYIQKTAKMLVDVHGTIEEGREPSELWLESLRGLATAEARTELLKFIGVGRKVADCVLLMSLDKKEVIPVDTHVHQIAIKHYGFKGLLKGKSPMTPKLYEEVNSKLVRIWGDYAGWAHSVLFTSDLKSFASYSVQNPTPSAPVKSSKRSNLESLLPTPPTTPSPSPLKRKASASPPESSDKSAGLADRMKRLRRK